MRPIVLPRQSRELASTKMEVTVWGVDRRFQFALQKGLPGIVAVPTQVDGIGAKAGSRLRSI